MIFYWLAALVLLGLTVFHLTAGQKEVVRPLFKADVLATDVICVLFLCWHVVTLVMLAAMAAYVAAALSRDRADLALAGTGLVGILAVWSLAVVVWKKLRHRDMPQWIAFGFVALLGLAGHLTR